MDLPPHRELPGPVRLGYEWPQPPLGDRVATGHRWQVESGYVPVEVTIGSDVGSAYLTAPPFTASLAVPPDYLGAIRIEAIAKDASDIVAFAEGVTIQVATDALLQGIDVVNSPLILTSGSPTGSISVVGHFDDGVDRLVSAAAFGTTYHSQKPAIVTVDADGRVVAQGLGTGVVDIENAGWTAQAVVVVTSLPLELRIAQGDVLQWAAQPSAIGYDIVRGNLDTLRVSGDFTTATEACLGNNVHATTLSDPQLPATGSAFWYLLRVVYSSSGAVGSYDVEGTGTARDEGISASSQACP